MPKNTRPRKTVKINLGPTPAQAVVTSTGIKTLPKVQKKSSSSIVATVGYVKRILGKAKENKMCSRGILDSVSFNSTITTDAYPLVPHVPEGTSDYQRIGDTIQPKGLYIKGDIGLNSSNSTDTKPMIARVMILEQRNIKDEGAMSLFDYKSLLKVNDADSGVLVRPYDTGPDANILPVNKTLFKVHFDRKYYLAPTVNGTSKEERTKQKRFFTCKIKCPKNLYYEAATDTDPTFCKNFSPFMVIGYQYADDTGGDNLNARVIANTRSYLYYEDA